MLQTTVIDMEWNTKWDWENLDVFSSKGVAITSPKKLQSSDWGIKEGENIDGSSNLSGVVHVDNNSSAKSSISASAESSFKDSMKVSNFSIENSRSFHNTCNKNKEFMGGDINGTSPSLEASVCSPDQSIGLRLGKRTYFENGFARSNTKACSAPDVAVTTVKKVKFSHQSTPIARCQAEGCNLDLSSSKEYHRKHRVCENHSKSLKVVVNGLERRFCQQCSRFHGLSEFDGKKRSCRRRLSDHNARRRKPQQDPIHFNSRSLSSSFYVAEGQQQLNFVLDNLPLAQTKPPINSIWETTCNSQHSPPMVKAEKPSEIQFPNGVNTPTLAFNKIMSSKGTTAGVFDQGSNTGLDLRRALSLLSNSSWGSSESDFSVLEHPMHTNGPTMAQHPAHQELPHEYWQVDQQSVDPRIHATHFQESHILKAPYGIQYVNHMDEILKPL